MLEYACFDFAQRNHPDILERNEWDCPEAAELDVWVKKLPELSLGSTVTGGLKKKLIRSMCDVRHAAVHRHRISVYLLDQMFQDSLRFLSLLGEYARREEMSHLRRIIVPALTELDKSESNVTSALQVEQNDIRKQRVELDVREESLVKAAEEKKRSLRQLAATDIADAVESWACGNAQIKKGGNALSRTTTTVDVVGFIEILLWAGCGISRAYLSLLRLLIGSFFSSTTQKAS